MQKNRGRQFGIITDKKSLRKWMEDKKGRVNNEEKNLCMVWNIAY